MALFTIIMDYDGGIYISQQYGDTPENALEEWGKVLDIATIDNFGPKSKEILINGVLDKENPLASLDKVKNVWCNCITVRNRFSLINIVKTSES